MLGYKTSYAFLEKTVTLQLVAFPLVTLRYWVKLLNPFSTFVLVSLIIIILQVNTDIHIDI